MFILYRKEDGYIIGRLSNLESVQQLISHSPVASEDLTYVEIADSVNLSPEQLNNSKYVNGEIIELTYEEKVDKDKKLNPVVVNKILKEENSQLTQALAEMSIYAAQQEQLNKDNQQAIAELSMMIATGGVVNV